jgi:hypothetical protein
MLNVVKLQDGNTITKFALYSLFFVRALGERSDCFRTASAGLSQRVFNPGIDNGLAFTDRPAVCNAISNSRARSYATVVSIGGSLNLSTIKISHRQIPPKQPS